MGLDEPFEAVEIVGKVGGPVAAGGMAMPIIYSITLGSRSAGTIR